MDILNTVQAVPGHVLVAPAAIDTKALERALEHAREPDWNIALKIWGSLRFAVGAGQGQQALYAAFGGGLADFGDQQKVIAVDERLIGAVGFAVGRGFVGF